MPFIYSQAQVDAIAAQIGDPAAALRLAAGHPACGKIGRSAPAVPDARQICWFSANLTGHPGLEPGSRLLGKG